MFELFIILKMIKNIDLNHWFLFKKATDLNHNLNYQWFKSMSLKSANPEIYEVIGQIAGIYLVEAIWFFNVKPDKSSN